MKRVLSMLLVLSLLCGLIPAVLADDAAPEDVLLIAGDPATGAAESLYELGLFQGTGDNADGTPNFALDKTPTRYEAVTMLVRLLGKEDEAKSQTWETPFTDVDEWAKPYVGYAYANGLTNGTGSTTFGGNVLTTAAQYLTFVLRALGYDSKTDFQWNEPWTLSDQIGLTSGQYSAENDADIVRGDLAVLSVTALPVPQKDSTETLAEKLISEGVFTEAQYEAATSDGAKDDDPAAPSEEEPAAPSEEEPAAPSGNEPLTRVMMAEGIVKHENIPVTPTGKVVSNGNTFADCDDLTDAQRGAIQALVNRGMVSGTGPTTFDPHGLITRAQLAVLLSRLYGVEPGGGTSAGPSDLDESAWWYFIVQAMYETGRITDDPFRANDAATMADLEAWMG